MSLLKWFAGLSAFASTLVLSGGSVLILVALAHVFNAIGLHWLDWIFDKTIWVHAATDFAAALCGAVYVLLPGAAQTAVGNSLTFVSTSPILVLVWKLAWYVLNIFTIPSIVVLVIGVYLVVYPVAYAIRGVKALYDLWPTRG